MTSSTTDRLQSCRKRRARSNAFQRACCSGQKQKAKDRMLSLLYSSAIASRVSWVTERMTKCKELLFILVGIGLMRQLSNQSLFEYLQSCVDNNMTAVEVVPPTKRKPKNELKFRVCNSADKTNNVTLPSASLDNEGVSYQFCLNCKMDAQETFGDITCGQRALFLEQSTNYNYSTPELAIRAVVAESPKSCCQQIPEKRKTRDAGVPGTIGDESNTITAWCILGGSNASTWKGFSHSAEALVPCWSYFCRVRERLPESKFGIWFLPPQDSTFRSHIEKSGWVGDFLQRFEFLYNFGSNEPPNLSWYYRPEKSWFQDPSDATLLSEVIFRDTSSENLVSQTMNQTDTLRIGLVQRQGHRRNISNLQEIQQQIKSYYPDATVEWAEMEDMSFMEQASYWHRQDVIVAAHGAAMTNALFMRRGTAVVEIFPIHYYVFMYQRLCQSMDVNHFAWIDDGIPYPEYDYLKHASSRFRLRSTLLTPPVWRIMDLVHQAVNASKGMH